MNQPIRMGINFEQRNQQFGVSFTLYSSQADRIELCLFEQNKEEQRFEMQLLNNHIWQLWLPNIRPETQYAYRIYGDNLCCNPNKLMLDPYAKYVVGKPNLATEQDRAWFLLTDPRNNAHLAPKGIVRESDDFDWGDDKSPQIPWQKTILYEMNVKGFSKLKEDLPESIRGTYAGLAHPNSISYLKELDITSVELLPVNFFINEPHLQQKGLSNYWGYNPLAMFALEPSYAATDNPEFEFKQMVKALHQAGIEVILDVVFNHSAESEKDYPTFSQRGIDDRSYYWQDELGNYLNWTGCGNMLNLASSAGRNWVIDCLKYWVSEYHIDGFRFDLATSLGRETPNYNQQAKLLQQMENDPILSKCKLISEPWDLGNGGYQVGQFPAYFAEWNDRYRDDMRLFWLWKNGNLATFAERFAGSSDIYKKENQLPHKTLNFLTAHDGFTLYDLVSYNQKHNMANGEDNRDGRNDNFSYNHGVEGCLDNLNEVDKSAVQNQRFFTQVALIRTLLLSNGTPMLLAGGEFGNTQYGNNNAYCQDNEISWLKWQNFDRSLFEITKQSIKLRQQIQSLISDQWWTEENVVWLNLLAEPMKIDDWHNQNIKAMQILLDNKWLFLINAKQEKQQFLLPNGIWQQINEKGCMTFNHYYDLEHLGLVVLQRNH